MIENVHQRCEVHLDRFFPKTNYDNPEVPSEGNRSAALALYGLMFVEFRKELEKVLADYQAELRKEIEDRISLAMIYNPNEEEKKDVDTYNEGISVAKERILLLLDKKEK